jgi:predicted nucleic acid-binding protein
MAGTPAPALMAEALDIAMTYDLTANDAAYVALSRGLGPGDSR